MAPPTDPRRVADVMLGWLDLDLVSCTELQTLWAGYGHVFAVEARPRSAAAAAADPVRLVLKMVSPPDPAGADEGHLRKMLSYEVEQSFYHSVAPGLDDDVAVARCLASTRHMPDRAAAAGIQHLVAMLLTDLRPRFPVAATGLRTLDRNQINAALAWLARFHATSWRWLPPADLDAFLLPPLDEMERRRGARVPAGPAGPGLWRNGGYTYLATRRTEYAALAADTGSEWSAALCAPAHGPGSPSIADMAAHVLAPRGRPCETYIHGDVKSENLFSTQSGDAVALFDFQYVGLGLGVCDLAKLFSCSVPIGCLVDDAAAAAAARGEPSDARRLALPMGRGERVLLGRYRDALLCRRPPGNDVDCGWDVFARHWETALVDWCRFQASWGFWGNTHWLQARVRWILADEGWRDWLRQEVKGQDVQIHGAAA